MHTWKRLLIALAIVVSGLGLAATAAGAEAPDANPIARRLAGILRVRDVDQPARRPFQQLFEFPFVPDQLGGSARFTVPDGYRLVIEYASGVAFTENGQIADYTITTTADGVMARHHLIVVAQGPAGGYASSYAVAQAVRLYADPGSEVIVHVNRTLGGRGEVSTSLSGHLVRVRGTAG